MNEHSERLIFHTASFIVVYRPMQDSFHLHTTTSCQELGLTTAARVVLVHGNVESPMEKNMAGFQGYFPTMEVCNWLTLCVVRCKNGRCGTDC